MRNPATKWATAMWLGLTALVGVPLTGCEMLDDARSAIRRSLPESSNSRTSEERSAERRTDGGKATAASDGKKTVLPSIAPISVTDAAPKDKAAGRKAGKSSPQTKTVKGGPGGDTESALEGGTEKDLAARVETLEKTVAALSDDFKEAQPAIERLVGIEADIRELLRQLAQLTEDANPIPLAAAPSTGAAARSAPSAAPATPAAPAAPTIAAKPEVGAKKSAAMVQGNLSASDKKIAPPAVLAAPAPAPLKEAIGPPKVLAPQAPAPRQEAIARPVAARPVDPRYGIHLASYKIRSNMFDGLRQLLRRHPEQLKNLDFRVSAAEIPNRGTYYRLKAGPFPSAQAAKAACRAFRRKNTYCVASDFAGNPVVQ